MNNILADYEGYPTTIHGGDILICEKADPAGYRLVLTRSARSVYWVKEELKDNKILARFLKDIGDLMDFVRLLAGSHGLHARLLKHDDRQPVFILEKSD
jgi:hypothetical protein